MYGYVIFLIVCIHDKLGDIMLGLFFFLETGSYYVDLAILELTL